MNLHFKELRDESVHARVHHQDGTISRIEYGQVKNGTEEILMFAKFLNPGLELPAPFVTISVCIIFGFKVELQLVVAVKSIPEYTHQVEVKLIQVFKVGVLMFLYFLRCLVHEAEWIVS